MMVLTILGVLLGIILQAGGTIYSVKHKPEWINVAIPVLAGTILLVWLGYDWIVLSIVFIHLVFTLKRKITAQ